MKQISVFTMSTLLIVGLTYGYFKIKNESDSNSLGHTSSTNQVQKQIEKMADQFYGSRDTPPAVYAPEKARFTKKDNNLFAKNKVEAQTETQLYDGQNTQDYRDDRDDVNKTPASPALTGATPSAPEEEMTDLPGLPSNLTEKKSDALETFVIPPMLKKPVVAKSIVKKEEDQLTLASSTTGGTPSSPTSLSCNSDITSGTFNHPVAVNITCNTTSTIKYCLSEGSCCDPVTNGLTYTGAIAIGQNDGNFCLSFYGSSENAGVSESLQQLYQFNLTLPDLQVAHTKQFYQTTELPDLSYVTSNDFGKVGYEIGQVNLKDHDPGISGENLDCEEIVTNNSSLTSPDALITQIFMDVSGLDSSMQVEIPLHPTQLHYNNNYVTSYIVNNNHAIPLYSCSTTLVRLLDFDFFASDAISGDAGTNQVREFTAGFTPYGFFEEEANTYRGPAGVSNSNVADQHLETGLFEIFF